MVLIDRLVGQMIPQLPKKWMSHYLGKMAHKQPPPWLRRKMIQSFVNYYGIKVEEAEKPLEEYTSLGDFFARRLKPGLRPIKGPLVHPCDSRIIQSGVIHNQTLIQAKGKKFTVEELVPMNPWNEQFEGGLFSTYYLSPQDYHRVHMPVKAKIRWVSVIPGELWPVNSWSVKNIDGLYAINERVAIGMESEKGFVIVVLVGATNVGKISVSFDRDIKTNQRKTTDPFHRTYTQPHCLEAGDELGCFHLGSSVVALYDQGFDLSPMRKKKVKIGQAVD